MSSNVWFTSDLHLGHDLAAEKRGYRDRIDHDDGVIYTLKQQMDKRSVLWVLGDVAMRLDSIDMLDSVLGRKWLVLGNHDQFDIQVYAQYFQKIYGFTKYKSFWLSHAPIHPSEFYRMKLNVHGHIHKNTDSPLLPYPYFNVNWDFWGRAINLDEIRNFYDNNVDVIPSIYQERT